MKARIFGALVLATWSSDVLARPICGGAPAGWRTPPALIPEFIPTVSIGLAASGDLRWNGVPVSRQRLRSLLIATRRTSSPSILAVFQPAPGAACAMVDQLRREIARYLDCPSLCGEGNLRYF